MSAVCTMAPPLQRLEALGIANQQRSARAVLKDAVRAGEVTLEELLFPVHPLAEPEALVDIIRWLHSRAPRTMEELGRWAVRDGVNLLLPAGRASTATRAWVIEHGEHRAQRRGRGAG